MEKPKQRQQIAALKCPRCQSMNTKFCYYNNHSLSQPRYLCKSCKRHWTEGGTLREVPVGGGRKGKRPRKSTTSSDSAAATANSNSATTSQKLPLPLVGGQEDSIFPDVLRRVLLQPPIQPQPTENSGLMSSMLSSSSFSYPMTGISQPTTIASGCDSININPLPISRSSGSTLQDQVLAGPLETRQELQAPPEMPPTSDAQNVLETTPSNYWSCWDDDVTGLFDAPDP